MGTAKQQLSSWQAKLTAEYGGDFRLFFQHLAEWSDAQPQTNLDAQALLENQALMANKKQVLCDYTQSYPSANVAQTFCSHITNWHTLRQTSIMLHTDGADTNIKTDLKQVEGQIQSLHSQINILSAQNEEQKAKLDALTKQYNDDLPNRKKQYEDIKTNLENIESIKNQFIVQAYLMRGDILNWEYALIKSYMGAHSALPQEEALSFFNKSLAKFRSFLAGQGEHELKGYCFAETNSEAISDSSSANEEAKNNPPCEHYLSGFPKGFKTPYKLISVLYSKALYSSNPQESLNLTNQPNTREGRTPLKEEEKQTLVLLWRHSPFISDFLNAKSHQINNLLQNNKEVPYEGGEDLPLFVDSSLAKNQEGHSLESNTLEATEKVSTLVMPYLFTQSFYQDVSFHQNTENNQTHYELIMGGKPLWFTLEDGKLEVP